MPRFSLKTLFLSTTLVAVGLGLVVCSFDLHKDHPALELTLWIISAALIGTGIGAPFTRSWLGVAAVVFLFTSFLFILICAAVSIHYVQSFYR